MVFDVDCIGVASVEIDAAAIPSVGDVVVVRDRRDSEAAFSAKVIVRGLSLEVSESGAVEPCVRLHMERVGK